MVILAAALGGSLAIISTIIHPTHPYLTQNINSRTLAHYQHGRLLRYLYVGRGRPSLFKHAGGSVYCIRQPTDPSDYDKDEGGSNLGSMRYSTGLACG